MHKIQWVLSHSETGNLKWENPQVRKSLYASAVGKWRRYERQLEGVRRRLQPIIEEYEGWPIPGLDHIQSGEL